MTDAQVDTNVDHSAEPIESDSGEPGAPEITGVTPDTDHPTAPPDDAVPSEPPDGDVTRDEQPAFALHDPATDCQTDLATDFQADPVEDSQAGPAEEQIVDDHAQSVPVSADATLGEPSATVAAPPLREPDEAALRLAEAAVFASATPMPPRTLSQILPDDLDAEAVIAALRARYEGRGLELCEVGGGLQFRTAADLAPQLRKVVQVPRRLPRVALETLAIVAYHQPITRPEIEELRGTGLSQQTLDVLLENDLVVARGRKETPGRPTLWGTTAKFLEYFGLRDIRELPRRQDLLLEAVRPEPQAEPVPDSASPKPAVTSPPVPNSTDDVTPQPLDPPFE
jgi:segregation and condensation protein B